MDQPAQERPRHLFRGWADGCRRYVDAATGASASEAATGFGELLHALPPALDDGEQEAARALLAAAWRRCVQAIVSAAGADPPASIDGEPLCGSDPRVERALSEIARGFADPGLRLGMVARRLAVSSSRLTQLLKQHTGRTFGAHLHASRIAEARTLLVVSRLSVKEIASRVGYSTTSQLDRHFRKAMGVMPSRYRSRTRQRADETSGPVG